MGSHPGFVADRHPWRAAVGLGLATIVLGMAYTMLFMPALTHGRGWWVVGGVWPPVLAARFVANGALGYVYSADPFFTAGPLGAVALVPVVVLGDALKLTDNYRYGIPHPTMWLVYGPFGLAFGMALLHAARALAQQAWVGEGMAGREIPPRHLWTQVAMVGLVLVPAAVVYGHFDDVLALAFVFLGIRSMLSGRFGRAALWLALGVATQQWALLAVPIVIGAAPVHSRARTLARTLVIPGPLMAFALAVDWRHAAPALLSPRAFPQFGHAALWVPRAAETAVRWPGRLGAVAIAVALGWWLGGRARPRVLLAGFALAFLSPLFLEPVVLAYYLVPSLALLFLHERLAGGSGLRTAAGGAAILLFFLVHPDPWLWWSVAAAGIGWLAAPAARDVLGLGWPPRRSAREPAEGISAPVDLTSVAS